MRRSLAVLLLATTAFAAPTAGKVEIRRAVVYARHDGVSLTGDLYLPAGPGPHPAIVAVHGGDWKFADASLYQHWGPYLAKRGYALFTINYRLLTADQGAYPQAVQDVRAAVQFLRGEGAALGVDPGRLALMGDSAGAHLASLAALAGDRAPFAGAYPADAHAGERARVKACIGIYGVYDLAAQWAQDRVAAPDDNISQAFLGAMPAEAPARYAEASPITYAASAGETAVLLVWGTKDDRVEPSQSATFARALRGAGAAVETTVIPGAPHYWASEPIWPGGYPARFAPHLLRFLKQHL